MAILFKPSIHHKTPPTSVAPPKAVIPAFKKAEDIPVQKNPTQKIANPFKTKGKTRITIWIDDETLAKFRASGRGWQTRIAELLRQAAPR